MRAAAVQMNSGTDVERNLAEARRWIEQAHREEGANLVVLPENFAFMGADDAARLGAAETAGDGPAQAFLADAARDVGVWLVGGTIPIRDERARARSRCLVFAPDGRLAAHYDKIHLFDVDVPGETGESYRESATTVAGSEPVVTDTALGRVGLSVCYDLRFPALFHRLGVLGMDALAVPAAFTVPTGRSHWLPLLQARAIESLVYVVASAQWGEHAGGRRTYGHTMILGPWGRVLAVRESNPGIVAADLDMIELREIRETFPALKHRREL